MEGIYFFGQHLRWNLGWSNPNQAGVFVAMMIPWLWGGYLASRGFSGSRLASVVVLLVELSLWFLLCKTYSRGALMALGIAGAVYGFASCLVGLPRPGWRPVMMRIGAVMALLVATGFFARIDPRFVSTDASAGNRLVLWKGGLQMIAVSPLRGWGEGQSGPGFMHWFQPLDANEQYAGMVNSYLHVGVEHGLPVLALVVGLAGGMCLLSGVAVGGAVRASGGKSGLSFMQLGAGCSLLVFLVANVFSTLWIFRDLWWLPAASCLWIIVGGKALLRGRFSKLAGITIGVSLLGSTVLAVGLWMGGKLATSDVNIVRSRDDGMISCSAGAKSKHEMLFFADKSVLGENWGKEVRRLATSPGGRAYKIFVAEAETSFSSHLVPEVVVACGRTFSTGITANLKYPDCAVILVHPVGRPILPDGKNGKISVILPMLDTERTGRLWRVCCKRNGWSCSTSPGVGQDARLVWPAILEARLHQE